MRSGVVMARSLATARMKCGTVVTMALCGRVVACGVCSPLGPPGGKAEQQTVQRCVEAAIHHGALALRWDCGRCLCCAEGAKHLTADPFANLRASGLRLSGTSS